MDIFELIRTVLVGVGFPVIISAAVSLFRLLHEYKDLIRRVDELEKTVSKQPSEIDHTILVNSISSIEKFIDKTSSVLEVMSNKISKHDVVLDTIQDKISELKDEMRTRPCISHIKGE